MICSRMRRFCRLINRFQGAIDVCISRPLCTIKLQKRRFSMKISNEINRIDFGGWPRLAL
jgi:hypothetical protein